MAHNTHIPWTLLSSHLKFTPISRRHRGETNLYPKYLPSQAGELTHFSNVFATTISSFSTSARSKLPTEIPVPKPDDTVIYLTVAQRISKTVSHYRSTNYRFIGRETCLPTCDSPWPFEDSNGCLCPVSPEDLTLRPWIEELDCSRSACERRCSYGDPHSETGELLKTLILYGEIETLLIIGAHPEIKFDCKWDPRGYDGNFGISGMMRGVLMSYVFLNVVYLHTETWEKETKKAYIERYKKSGTDYTDEEIDYRQMAAYERVLRKCTSRMKYDVHTYPHRLFYGVTGNAFTGVRCRQPSCDLACNGHLELGKLKIGEDDQYIPDSEDVDIVLFYLSLKGLPTEIGISILEYAGFKPERRLPVANDPMDPRNREELKKYLSWCWQVLVSCDVIMTSQGNKISWAYELRDVISDLFGHDAHGSGKKLCKYLSPDQEAEEDERLGNLLGVSYRRLIFA